MMFADYWSLVRDDNYGIMQFKYNIAFSDFKAAFLNYEQLQT